MCAAGSKPRVCFNLFVMNFVLRCFAISLICGKHSPPSQGADVIPSDFMDLRQHLTFSLMSLGGD